MTRITLALLTTASLLLVASAQSPQGGDQFLDGIGETGLVARYVLGGNVEDASRNQLHAALSGSGAEFVEDAQFRQVLLLTGDGSHVVLPGRALEAEDTMSVVGWVYLPTGASGPVFDFGRDAANRLSAFASRSGLRATIVADGQVRGAISSGAVPENQWVHFGVVLDSASQVMTLYVDGARAGQATGVAARAADIGATSASANRLFLGRSLEDGIPSLHARLRDVRIYRVALADEQAATIRANALSVGQTARARGRGARPVISTANIPDEWALAARLSHVPDITVETIVGTLPRLPPTVRPVYRDNARGPDVRVLWPAPTDTTAVLRPGTYTVTGRIAGTTLTPKATVIVKVPIGTMTPPSRLAEPFLLSDVVLDRDAQRTRDAVHRATATSSSAASPRPTPTASSTTSGTRSASRSRPAPHSSKDGTTRRRGCAGTRAATT